MLHYEWVPVYLYVYSINLNIMVIAILKLDFFFYGNHFRCKPITIGYRLFV